MKLWDYEVVEAFFLSSNSERYLELEFGPHGQHLVLLLDGRRNAIRHSLPLEYQATIIGELWKGEAKVIENPTAYVYAFQTCVFTSNYLDRTGPDAVLVYRSSVFMFSGAKGVLS